MFFFYLRALETIFGTLKIGKNNPEIANLEFESHRFLKIIFSFQLKNWAKYMVNGTSRREFSGISQLARLKGAQNVQRAHCAM